MKIINKKQDKYIIYIYDSYEERNNHINNSTTEIAKIYGDGTKKNPLTAVFKK